MPRDLGIAERLRRAGLNVVEVEGWRTRGSESFHPRGSLDHGTAGARTGNAPSLRICIQGRSDLAGPLCHVLVGRDNTCYVIAAGRAQHAGRGGWRGLSGNSTVYGVERETVGTTAEPWRPDQTRTAARVHAALIRGRAGAEMVCRHAEWAPGRKVDTHSLAGSLLRELVAAELARLDGDVPDEGDDDVARIAMLEAPAGPDPGAPLALWALPESGRAWHVPSPAVHEALVRAGLVDATVGPTRVGWDVIHSLREAS